MGKKKGFNWKARSVPNIKIDDSDTKQIKIDINADKEKFDDSNPLVLPNKKRATKNKDKAKKLSLNPKKKKRLEKILRDKKKKEERVKLLEELSQTTVPDNELKQYMSITTIQTKGLKRHFQETDFESKLNPYLSNTNSATSESIVNVLRGVKKRKLTTFKKFLNDPNKIKDPNVLGFTDSSEDEEDEDNESGVEVEEDKNDNETSDKMKNKNEKAKDTTESENKEDQEPEKKLIEENTKQLKDTEKSENQKEIKPPENKELPEKIVKVVDRKPAVFVSVDRKPEVQEARMKLPILAEEQLVVETINENPVVIITGETGSGKTTQVPQFLYEAGYAKDKMIGITEPRRVAAISMSKRVAEEMNLTEKEVSYLIRFEGNTTPETKIKFMTDGVLLKEVQNDFLLKKYSVIILDEAHERSVYTDILIGLLTRIVSLRTKRNEPLKLIIMSATLRVEDFVSNTRLFKVKPPIMTVESRQFPVTIHFNRNTNPDYVKEVVKKAAKIHTQLPEGGILIFLTGQKEVNTVVRRLRKAFPYREKKLSKNPEEETKKKGKRKKKIKNNEDNEKEDEEEAVKSDENLDDDFFKKKNKSKRKKVTEIKLPKISLDAYSIVPDDGHDDLIDLENEGGNDEDEDDEDDIDLSDAKNLEPLWVIPLYSLLPSHKQAKVFEPPPEGYRLCVVSTNVAETSLTIPNIKYVVDSGKCKTKMYDKVTGVTTFAITWASKAAANQRAGRAGRMGPGHCYRLYSSAVFNDQFEAFSEPEIRRKPVDDLLLQMKVMNIDKAVNFPFPTPPGDEQLRMAEKRLCVLGALEQTNRLKKDLYCAKITELGRTIAAFPVLPRYGKMLALSKQHNLIAYTVCMVAALSVQELLIEASSSEEEVKNKWIQTRRFWAGTGNSFYLGDPMVFIRAVGAAEFASVKGKLSKFCEEHGLREKAMIEIRKLRHQLTNEIVLSVPGLDLSIDPKMLPPTDMEAKLLRQIILAGMADQVAHKLSPDEIKEYVNNSEGGKTKWKYAYKTIEMEDPVFMHSSCVLRKSAPEWVVYQELYETTKTYMRGVTAIEPEWLPKFAPTLCSLSDTMIDPPPRYNEETGKVMCHKTGTFGPTGWELPSIEIEFPKEVEGIKWFAQFFLEGKVFPKLKKYVKSLISTPSTLNKSYAKLIPRVEIMIQSLLSKSVMSRDKMVEVWEEDSNFLLSAYQKWLPESAHAEVMLMWPPM